MKRSSDAPAPLRGSKWRETHQATIDSILGPDCRTVRSQGSQFYNTDNWTARIFIGAMCEWARLNKGRVPDIRDVEGWVFAANRPLVSQWQKGITIASTPDELPKGLSFALIGGGYHESWHTEWSRTTYIRVDEVWPKIEQLWKLLPYAPEQNRPGWTGLTGPLLEWSNIIEDIRIERLGCKKYPGSLEKMEALQDLILEQEEAGNQASEHRGLPRNNDLYVVVGAFRDIGLGYDTPRQRGVLNQYQTRSPGGWKFVNEGPLKPMLDKSIALSATDSLGSLWLAMEVVAAIAETVANPPPKKAPKSSSPAQGPQKVAQPELEEEEETPPEPKKEKKPEKAPPMSENDKKKMSLILYKVGDRAKVKSGPYAGREVEVVRAGLPAEDGVQELEFALVEEE